MCGELVIEIEGEGGGVAFYGVQITLTNVV